MTMKPKAISIAIHVAYLAAAAATRAPCGEGTSTIDTIQVKFADPVEGNVVLVQWERPAAGTAPVEVLVDGSVAATGTATQGLNEIAVTQVPDGQHLFEIIEGSSQVGFLSQEVKPSAPLGQPFNVTCVVEEDDCEIVIEGESGGPPSTYVEFMIDGVAQPERSVMVFDSGFTFEGRFQLTTKGLHTVQVHAVGVRGDGFLFENGSYRLEASTTCTSTCGPPGSVSYVPGLCNGVGVGPLGRQPDISTAVFGLSWLFAGTREPPCVAACDSTGDGEVDISDMVRVLNYLFSGGPPPVGWVGGNPTCKAPAAGEDCAAGHDACGA